MPFRRRPVSLLLPTALGLVATLLTGCGSSFTSQSDAVSTPLGTIQGVVHGGQQAIAGAHIYLFAIGTGGYGGDSVSLLQPGANTTADTATFPGQTIYYVTGGSAASGGAFTISGDYTCTVGQQVYLYAVGGSSNSGTSINSGIGLLAGLGACPATGTLATQVPYVTLNEVTTVATAYALAGFAVDPTHISSDAGVSGNTHAAQATDGVANAMANVANIVNIGEGTALATTSTSGSAGTVPQATLYTLANILASCINSPSVSSSTCTTLFETATTNGVPTSSTGGATNPTNTAAAAINIAHNPADNVSTLYSLSTGTGAPFTGLTSQPHDLALTISYTGAGLNYPSGVAVDASGNVWVANSSASSISELSPTGAPLSGASGYTGSDGNNGGLNGEYALAIDRAGDIWITDAGSNALSEFSSAGQPLSGPDGFDAGDFNVPQGLTIDGSGNIWVANAAKNSSNAYFVSEYTPGSATLASYTTATLASPISITVDGSNNVWVANSLQDANGNDSISEFSPPSYTGSGFEDNSFDGPSSIAIDSTGDIWVTGDNDALTKVSNSSGTPSQVFTSGASLDLPFAVALDGAGNAWAANTDSNSVSEFSSAGAMLTGASGLSGSGNINAPNSIAIDGSGNVWIGDSDLVHGVSAVTEYLGAAVPVITPIAAGLPSTPSANGSSDLGTRP